MQLNDTLKENLFHKELHTVCVLGLIQRELEYLRDRATSISRDTSLLKMSK
jgi:hypothetical protein